MARRRDRRPPTVVSPAVKNLGEAKALGVRDVAFHKKAGLRVMDMVKSDHFRAYVWSSVVAYNRALFARLKPG